MSKSAFAERLEGVGARLLFRLFKALPLDAASALGGFIARSIGPRLGVTRRARRNLRRALPELGAAAETRILRQMWDNLGRVVAEYPHLTRIPVFTAESPVAGIGLRHIVEAEATAKPILLVSAHFGNWEIGGLAAVRHGLRLLQLYRAANNKVVDGLMRDIRHEMGAETTPKGLQGARRVMAALKDGRTVVLLADQKMNDGIAVPFFGRDAMTAPAVAELALRFDAKLVMARVHRLKGASFRLIIDPPMPLARTGDRHADVLSLMTAINKRIEDWIREDPGQWFWVHRRWPDS
jgi:KDO2-lipid IV(A) lauroyltransferase